jgi:hypothetical protein
MVSRAAAKFALPPSILETANPMAIIEYRQEFANPRRRANARQYLFLARDLNSGIAAS